MLGQTLPQHPRNCTVHAHVCIDQASTCLDLQALTEFEGRINKTTPAGLHLTKNTTSFLAVARRSGFQQSLAYGISP